MGAISMMLCLRLSMYRGIGKSLDVVFCRTDKATNKTLADSWGTVLENDGCIVNTVRQRHTPQVCTGRSEKSTTLAKLCFPKDFSLRASEHVSCWSSPVFLPSDLCLFNRIRTIMFSTNTLHQVSWPSAAGDFFFLAVVWYRYHLETCRCCCAM